MPSSLLTNLNTAFSLSFQRAVRVKQARNLVKALATWHTRHCGNRMTAAASGTTGAASSGDFVVDSLISSTTGDASGFGKGSVSFGDKRAWSCQKARLSMRRIGDRCRNACLWVNGTGSNLLFDVMPWYGKNSPVFELWSCGGSGGGYVSLRCYSEGTVPDVSDDSEGAVPDVSGDGLSYVEPVGGLAVSDEQATGSDRALKLLSGSCYLPHPDKEKTGGEDAHFICTEEQVIGVADGVGGWADLGVNAGEFSRELMSNSVNAIRQEPKGLIDPLRVLEKAHQLATAQGSSTACIIALTEQGLHAINLGDSGFIVVRDGRTIFESPPQQHSFNFTYQLESGNRADVPSSGQVFAIPVAAGDVIVAGTDGLFDNLYNNEVSSTVAHSVLGGLTPDATAQKIAALARQRALDRKRQTPFATAAQEAGFHYYGGKLDDITVVVSYITN